MLKRREIVSVHVGRSVKVVSESVCAFVAGQTEPAPTAHLSPENVRAAVSALDGVAQNCHTNFNVTELGNTKALI